MASVGRFSLYEAAGSLFYPTESLETVREGGAVIIDDGAGLQEWETERVAGAFRAALVQVMP